MADTIEIQVLDSCVGTDFVYAKGGIYHAPAERAKDLIRGGLAVPVKIEAERREQTVNEQREIRAKGKK